MVDQIGYIPWKRIFEKLTSGEDGPKNMEGLYDSVLDNISVRGQASKMKTDEVMGLLTHLVQYVKTVRNDYRELSPEEILTIILLQLSNSVH